MVETRFIDSLPHALPALLPPWDAQLRIPESIPGSEEEWLYLAICAAFFVFLGLACGYFVWRKGHMQTLDAETEVIRTENELRSLREDLGEEERQLRGGEESELIESVLEDKARKRAETAKSSGE